MSQDIPDKKIREQFWELDRDGLPKFKENEITITRERLRERPAQMTARKRRLYSNSFLQFKKK